MSLPFLLDLHTEVSGSWEHPFPHSALNYSTVAGLSELCYGRMPRVEINLVNYLSPRTSSSMWLNFSGIKEYDKAILLDAPVLPFGLFGASVETVVNRFREVRAQMAAFGKFIPHRVQAPPRTSEPLPGTSS